MICKIRFDAQGSTCNISSCTSHRAFSLIELIVAILLSSVVMGAIYSVYRFQTRSLKVQGDRIEAQEYARSVLDLMVREIRNAGYDPTDAGCAGIMAANAQTVRFTHDANANGNCADPDEDITYSFVPGCATDFGNITRDDANDTEPAQPLTDCNVPDVAGKFSLAYYPKDCSNNFSTPVGTGTAACPGTAGGDAGTLAAVQRVKITVTGHSKNPDTDFGGQLKSTMTSNVDLRNIGLPP